MTRGKKLILLLAVLAVAAAGAYIALQISLQEEVEVEEAQPILTGLAAEDITSISWTCEGETLTFQKEGDSWTYAGDSAFPLQESQLTSMAETLAGLTAEKTIEDPADLSEYGLEEGTLTLSVSNGEKTWDLTLGDTSTMDAEQQYLSDGEGTVYLIGQSLGETFSKGLYDLVAKESIPAMDQVNALTVEIASTGSQTLVWEENSGRAYSDDYTWFLRQADGSYLTLDPENAQDYVDQVAQLTWGDCVNYSAGEEELASYGLDQPNVVVTVDYTETSTDEEGNTTETDSTFVLEVGDYTGEGCYARIAGSDMVYLIDGTVGDTLLYTDPATLLPDDILRMDWDTVEQVEIDLDGTTYTLEQVTRETEDEDGEPVTETAWTLDGTDVDFDSVSDLLDSMASSGSAQSDPQLSGEITFRFTRNTDTFQTVTLAFSQYDSENCLVTLDGESRLLAARTDVESLEEAVLALANGEDDSTGAETAEGAEETGADHTTVE